MNVLLKVNQACRIGGSNSKEDETEQMSNQGVLWIVVNLHDEFGQGTATDRIPVERGDTSIPEWRIDTARMTETPEPMICPIMEERGSVWLDTLDTPAKSVKEPVHLHMWTSRQ